MENKTIEGFIFDCCYK